MNYALLSKKARKQYWKHRRWHPPQRTDWPWITFIGIAMLFIFLALCSGCTVISNDRVFPKLSPFWTDEAKAQRASDARHKQAEYDSNYSWNPLLTNSFQPKP